MLVSGGSSTGVGEDCFAFVQLLPVGDKWKYKGKTVTLIDERAISQSEHTGLFLEARLRDGLHRQPHGGGQWRRYHSHFAWQYHGSVYRA